MDYANTTNVEFIVDPKILFHGLLIYSYLQIFKLIKCTWLPGECADWFFDNIMTWSYCMHGWYNMSRQKNSILIHEHAPNCQPVPLKCLPLIVSVFYLLFSSLYFFCIDSSKNRLIRSRQRFVLVVICFFVCLHLSKKFKEIKPLTSQ